MGVIVNKDNEQDEISRRIRADLRERAMETVEVDEADGPDFAEDSEYLKNMQKTSKFGWMWGVLIVLALLALIPIFLW